MKMCKCGCPGTLITKDGYVAGHRPVIGKGLSPFMIRVADRDKARTLDNEVGPHSISIGRILPKTYDAGDGSTVFIIRYQPAMCPAWYSVWAINARGVTAHVFGEEVCRAYDDLERAHAAAFAYAEYSTLLRQALTRFRQEMIERALRATAELSADPAKLSAAVDAVQPKMTANAVRRQFLTYCENLMFGACITDADAIITNLEHLIKAHPRASKFNAIAEEAQRWAARGQGAILADELAKLRKMAK